jgi:hypothetical protein
VTALQLPCPFLQGPVELTRERAKHIAEQHPELLPAHLDRIGATLARPDKIRRSIRSDHGKLFSRWYADLLGGKHVVVVVMTDSEDRGRHWVVAAYLARRLAEGVVEWQPS